MAYCTLTENTAYLKEVGIGGDAADIVTTDEANKARSYADNVIHEKLGTTFELVGGSYPPAIVDIAEMLACAQLYRFVHAVHIMQGGAETAEGSPATVLEKRALERLKDIKEGRAFIQASDGTWVSGYGPTDGAGGVAANEEYDDDAIFDLRQKDPSQYPTVQTAYDWPTLNREDDDDE